MGFKENTVLFFATGIFIGHLPFAPGTFGTLLGLPLCFCFSRIDLWIALILIALLVLAAIGIAHLAERILRQSDPGCIVIDEIAGTVVTFIGIPFNPFSALVGFVLFRMMDILKPFPIRLAEKKVPGGAGVVLDDLLAGVYSNLLLRFVVMIKDSF